MIEVRKLTKSYRVKNGRHYVFRGVDAVFPEGANIAIIGPNGGGKSTFLRILGGIDHPDSGKIITERTFSWPLGLKGGFVPHLSGRDNCRMVCNLYGIHPRNTRKQLEKIKELSGIGKYFEEPVHTYSSGMGGRLGFALSMSFDFDYFLIDEVTAVGDANFKNLAKEALLEKAKRSKVIMVSHSMGDIKKFCDIGVVLREGKLTVYEDLDEAIRAYLPQTAEAKDDDSELRRQASLEEVELEKIPLPPEITTLSAKVGDLRQAVLGKLANPNHTFRGNECEVYSLLGQLHQRLGMPSQAEEFYRRAVAEDAYHLNSQLQLAALAAARDDPEAERNALAAAEKIDPHNPNVALAHARSSFRRGDYEHAIELLTDLLKKTPQNPSAWNLRAHSFQKLSQLDKALDAQIKAVKFAPKNAQFLQQLKGLLSAANQFEHAARAAQKATSLPTPPLQNELAATLNLLQVIDKRIEV